MLIGETLVRNRYPRAQEMELSYGWSRTYYSKQKRLLKDLQLDQWYAYPEIAVRQFIFALYTFFGHNLNIENNVDQLKVKNLIKLTAVTNLSPNQQQQLELIMTLALMRLPVATEELKLTNLWLTSAPSFVSTLATTLGCDAQRATIEAQLLVQGLFEQGLLAPTLREDLQINPAYGTELSAIIATITSNMATLLTTGSQAIQADFVTTAAQIILSEKYTEGFASEFDITRTRYFEDIYPTLNRLVVKFVQALLAQHILTEQYQVDRVYFKLISYILVSDFDISGFDQVEVCFDFSGGKYVNQFMMEMFKTYVNINVVTTTTITSTTDIYLGDYFKPQLLIEQLIWVKPPTALDWSKLGDMIAQAKVSKYGHVKEE